MGFKKVLIIDDDEVDLYVSKRVIKESAFAEEIVTAGSVNDAMEYLISHDSPDGFPDFIFLDLNMPGQTGLDFLNEYSFFAKEKKRTCCIALLMNVVNSGHADTQKAKKHPLVNYVFEKPLSADKLKTISAV
jgi:CheY-like chemotaxis protein